MHENRKSLIYRCPECFARDVDINLLFDSRSTEYYCLKCCFTGSQHDILHQYSLFQKNKYRALEYFRKGNHNS